MKTEQIERTFEILESTGLNWSVKKESLQTADGKETGSFGIFRSDNNAWLGTVGNVYEPYQNSSLAELVVEATDALNVPVIGGGQLAAGRKVFFQAALPDEFIGKSSIKRNITALNSHDGHTSIGFGTTNTVVICQNTFYRALGEVSKVRHTTTAGARLDAMVADLRRVMGMESQLMESFKRMADMPLRDEAIERVIRRIFNVEVGTKQSDISTRKQNQINGFAGALTREVADEGKTVWALFNAVTRYTNHIAAPETAESKMNYLIDGGGARLSNLAYDEIMKWVSSNSFGEMVPVTK